MNPAQRSLLKISEELGIPELTALPISIGNPKGHMAFVSPNGITVSKAVIDTHPELVGMLVGHEILHPVIHDEEITGPYSAITVNYAEDYIINEILFSKFGYDARLLKGLFNRKYGKTELGELCKLLSKVPKTHGEASVAWGHHPLVGKLAERVSQNLGYPIVDFFYLDQVDRNTFWSSALDHSKFPVYEIPKLRVEAVTRGLWASLYKETLVSTRLGEGKLSNSEAVCYCFPASKLRLSTKGHSNLAYLGSIKYLEAVSNDAEWLNSQLARAGEKVLWFREVIQKRGLIRRNDTPEKRQKRFADARRKLPIAKANLEKLKKAKSVQTLMKEGYSVEVSAFTENTKNRESMNSLSKTRIEKAQAPILPVLVKGRLYKRLRAIAGRVVTSVEKAANTMTRINGSFGVDPVSQKSTGDRLKKMKEAMKEIDKVKSVDTANQTTLSRPNKGGGAKDDGQTQDDNEQYVIPGDDSGESGGESTTLGGGRQIKGPKRRTPGAGIGSHQGVEAEDESLELLVCDNNSVTNTLLDKVEGFEKSLRSRPKSKESDLGPEVSLSFSGDPSLAVASELALMRDEYAKLDFLARLAQHSVLSYVPPKKLNIPVVIAIDGSGSMKGENYQNASAFAMAMVKVLMEEGRSSAILLFSGAVDRMIVQEPGHPFSLDIIRMFLRRPSYGGTVLNAPLLAAQDLRDLKGWKNVHTLLISDTEGHVSEDQILLNKLPKDQNTLVSTGEYSSLSKGKVFDRVFLTPKKIMSGESLIEAGISIL